MNIQLLLFGTVTLFVIHITRISGQCPASAISTSDEDVSEIPVYYWRDYAGVIPEDAIEGGTDKDGNPTYIGQVYIKNKILPAIIMRDCKIARTTDNGKVVISNKLIKILCSENKENFEWVPTKTKNLRSLSDRHFVVGGKAAREVAYIGRVTHNDELIIGKVFMDSSSNKGLTIPYRNKRLRFQEFEILTYDISKEPDRVPLDIDIRIF